jgi:DNA-binding ferritin-like protein
MSELLTLLFQARNIAHVLHWKSKSFSMHLALGELYETLISFADDLAEMYMGRHGTDFDIDANATSDLDQHDAANFIKQLDDKLEGMKSTFAQEDFLINKFEELQAVVSQTRYKLENLR